jgi:hypothetical protein
MLSRNKTVRFWILLVPLFTVCQGEIKPIPDYLDNEIVIGSYDESSYWLNIEDSTLFYDQNNYWDRPKVLTWVDLDLDGDDRIDIKLQSSRIKEKNPKTPSGQQAVYYFTYAKLSVHVYDTTAEWMILMDSDHVARLESGDIIDLKKAELETFFNEKTIFYCNDQEIPVIANQNTGGWWRTKRSSFLLIREMDISVCV